MCQCPVRIINYQFHQMSLKIEEETLKDVEEKVAILPAAETESNSESPKMTQKEYKLILEKKYTYLMLSDPLLIRYQETRII